MELLVGGEAKAKWDLVEDADVGVGDMGTEACARRVLMAKPTPDVPCSWPTSVGDDKMEQGEEERLDRGILDNSPTKPGGFEVAHSKVGVGKPFISGASEYSAPGK